MLGRRILCVAAGMSVIASLGGAECTTELALWPLPQNCTTGQQQTAIPSQCTDLRIDVVGPEGPGLDCLRSAAARLQSAIFGAPCKPDPASKAAITIRVSKTEVWPPVRPGQVDESFQIGIPTGPLAVVNISSSTAAGGLHALRVVSQIMARDDSGAVVVQGVPASISDAPVLRHRGVMMDTARHFLPIDTLKRVVDGASASGLNALHLHLTDAESFPLEVPSLPELAGKGAYSPKATYTAAALTGLVQYASDRGVVIIPEIDVPGHAYSWGLGYPNTTANCPDYEHNINNIPLNPAVQFTADALQATLEQVASIFPSELIHIGGDEVVLGCWGEDPSVRALMQQNHWSSLTQVFQFFVTQADGIVKALDAGTRTPVHWQDVYDSSVTVESSDVYQVWRSTDDVGVLAKAGFDVVVSAESTGWYLNCGFNPGCTYSSWETVYQADILAGTDSEDRHHIIGGEAVLFGEFVNPSSVDDQLWPRAAAVSERLWVSQAVNDTVEALPRLTAHACRLQALGIGSAPTGPGYCDPSLFVAFS